MTIDDIKQNSTMSASNECLCYEDKLKFDDIVEEAEKEGGKLKQIQDNYDGYFAENDTHYLVYDCGIIDLYKKNK